MDEIARKLRGLLGVGLGWGAAWAAIGAVVGMVLAVVSPVPWDQNPVTGLALGMGLYGFVSGVGFGKLLAFWEREHTLEEIPLSRMTLWGVAGSALVPVVFALLGLFQPGTTGRDLFEAMLMTALLGGASAAGSLALARRAGAPEETSALGLGADPPLLDAASFPDPLEAELRERDRVV